MLQHGELRIAGGDLVMGESSEQHVEHLLLAQKGEYKQFPLTGVGILNYLNAPLGSVRRLELEREIRLQLEADGVRNAAVKVTPEGRVEIKRADYP